MTDKGETKPFSAGELARAAGVSPDTLRHYERKGVIAKPQRSANGYRQYDAATLPRVRMIRRALAIGFTLDELAAILTQRDRGGTPCQKVRQLAGDKLASTEQRLKELIELRNQLRAILKEWDVRLAKTSAGERAGLLDALPPRPNSAKRAVPFSTNNKLEVKWRQRK